MLMQLFLYVLSSKNGIYACKRCYETNTRIKNKRNARQQRAYQKRKTNETITEEREEKRKQNEDQDKEYWKRKLDKMTGEKWEE